jgi:uncharacterized membrane protein YadS
MSCIVAVVCVLGLLIMNDWNIFLWPRIYMFLPLSICLFGIAIGATVTEASKGVRVYSSIEGFVFVPKP